MKKAIILFGTALLLMAMVGLFDAVYLTVKHYTKSDVNCTITKGCEQVLTSSYATPFGIPMGLMGAVYYLGIALLAGIFLDSGKIKFLTWIYLLSSMGFLFTLYLLYLQKYIIGAYCQYCLLSALTTTSIFLTAGYGFSFFRKKQVERA